MVQDQTAQMSEKESLKSNLSPNNSNKENLSDWPKRQLSPITTAYSLTMETTIITGIVIIAFGVKDLRKKR